MNISYVRNTFYYLLIICLTPFSCNQVNDPAGDKTDAVSLAGAEKDSLRLLLIDSLQVAAYDHPDPVSLSRDSLISVIDSEPGKPSETVLAKIYFLDAIIEYIQGNYNQAMALARKAGAQFLNLDDSTAYYIACSTMGALHMYMANYDSSLNYLLEAYHYFEKENLPEHLIRTSINLSGTYFYMNEPEISLHYLRKSLQAHQQHPSSRTLSRTLINMGIMLEELGRVEDARDTLLLGLNEAFIHREVSIVTDAYNRLALLELKEGNFDLSLHYFEELFKESEERSDRFILCEALIHMSMAYDSLGMSTKAMESAREAHSLSKEIESKDQQSAAAKRLAELYASEGQFQKSNMLLIEHISLYSEVLNEAKSRQIVEMETKYQTRQKQEELEKLTLENRLGKMETQKFRLLFFYSLFLLIFIILLALLFIRQNRIRTRQNLLDLEQRLFRLQLNPHFIFNALSVIQSSILKQETGEAIQFSSGFAKLMRQILKGSEYELIPLEDELEMLEHYLLIQKKRYEGVFTYRFNRGINLEEDVLVPPMMLQPFIENAIEHGLRPRKKGGALEIGICMSGSRLTISIKDNGVGRRQAAKHSDKEHESLATSIMFKRFRNLSRKHKKKFLLQINDLLRPDGKACGTEVLLDLPSNLSE